MRTSEIEAEQQYEKRQSLLNAALNLLGYHDTRGICREVHNTYS